MRNIALLFCVFFTITYLNAQQKSNNIIKYTGTVKIINSDWAFNYFPKETANKGYESPALDDSRWSAISIPHTWNTFETTGEFEPYYERIGVRFSMTNHLKAGLTVKAHGLSSDIFEWTIAYTFHKDPNKYL